MCTSCGLPRLYKRGISGVEHLNKGTLGHTRSVPYLQTCLTHHGGGDPISPNSGEAFWPEGEQFHRKGVCDNTLTGVVQETSVAATTTKKGKAKYQGS